MKVSQLIEALSEMPQDADVITFANNHSTSHHDTMRIGSGMMNFADPTHNRLAVMIGNWSETRMSEPNGPKIDGLVHVILARGQWFRFVAIDGQLKVL